MMLNCFGINKLHGFMMHHVMWAVGCISCKKYYSFQFSNVDGYVSIIYQMWYMLWTGLNYQYLSLRTTSLFKYSCIRLIIIYLMYDDVRFLKIKTGLRENTQHAHVHTLECVCVCVCVCVIYKSSQDYK